MYAIYARQSVEKRDSVSIEMQIALCQQLVPAEMQTEIFADAGYSGTHVRRPAFQDMLTAIQKGQVQGVVVYKLDRISRSLRDFARLSEALEAHHVQLISYGEHLDTATPMGMMLVQLLILFAEMEQKTISTRIRDNYYARAEKKMALGGIPPFGFGKHWTPDPAQAAVVVSTFQQALCGKSLDAIARTLNQAQIPAAKGGHWSGMQIGRMLKNPAYVCSDGAVYAYFQRMGAKLLHPAEAYGTGCGCIALESQGQLVVAAGTHGGLIPSDQWLAVQEIRSRKTPARNGGSGQQSWLQGLVRCGKCGAACYVRGNGKGAPYLYFVCRGKRQGQCRGLHGVRTELVEAIVGEILAEEVQRLETVDVAVPDSVAIACGQLDRCIGEVLHRMETYPEAVAELEQLYAQRSRLVEGMEDAFHKKCGKGENLWKAQSFSQKKALAQLLIRYVVLTEDTVTVLLSG